MPPHELESWSDFEGALANLNYERRERSERLGRGFHELLFRGLGNSEWGLETTLERAYPSECCYEDQSLRNYYGLIAASKSAIETMSGRRWDRLPTFPEFDKRLSDHVSGSHWLDMLLIGLPEVYEYLVYLRHHGYPSPLLDWSRSPYVAAFFAFDDPPEGAKRVAVYALLQDTSYYASSDAHLFLVGPYMRTHQRHLVQQCQYSMCVTIDHDASDYFFCPHTGGLTNAVGREGDLVTITIPIEEREAALRQLDLMNINAFSLFGSEDSLIRTVARRELLLRGRGRLK